MRKVKGKCSVRIMIYRIITVIVILCLTLLTLEVITGSNDGRRQIVDEDGGVEVNVPINLSVDKENGGAVQ